MRADGEEDVVVPLGDFNHLGGLRDLGADGDHPLDADGARALDDRVEVAGEVGEIEMAMAVDEGHAAFSAKRGRWPEGTDGVRKAGWS